MGFRVRIKVPDTKKGGIFNYRSLIEGLQTL